MKKFLFLFLILGATAIQAADGGSKKLQTVREAPQYLSTDGTAVEDTCPGNDIFNQFFCSSKEKPGLNALMCTAYKATP